MEEHLKEQKQEQEYMQDKCNPCEVNLSSCFWSFVYSSLQLSQDDIVSTYEYQLISYASNMNKKIVIDFNAIWDDEADIVILNFPENALRYFDSCRFQFVYHNVHDLFTCILEIYEKINELGIYALSDDIYECSQKYNPRLVSLKKCIEKIQFMVDMTNNLEKLWNLNIM